MVMQEKLMYCNRRLDDLMVKVTSVIQQLSREVGNDVKRLK